jgi:4-amino-4-deoxy-L-arabinose transferase-like glycosyltransferase
MPFPDATCHVRAAHWALEVSLAVTAAPADRAGTRVPSLRVFAMPAAIVVLLVMLVPLYLARPANLTSDESLYLCEAYNIAHGHGFTYPSGEAITHRAPLFPLAIAPAVAIGGASAAYELSRLIIVLNVVLLAALAWRVRGPLAGVAAGFLAVASSYLNGFGTMLYLDPFQCSFLLLALIALNEAITRTQTRWFVAGGVALGLAFLAKESAVQWAPIALIGCLAIPSWRSRDGAWGAIACTAALCLVLAPWYAWVAVQDGDLYMAGALTTAKAGLVALFVAGLAGAGLAAKRTAIVDRLRDASGALVAGAVLVSTLAWCAFLLIMITLGATWPYPNDYFATVPEYTLNVATAVQPFYLVAIAWPWLFWRSARDERTRLIALAAVLFLPFVLFAANRGLQLRDALPLVYLSYLALAIAVADVLDALGRFLREPAARAVVYAAFAVMACLFALQQATVLKLNNDRDTVPDVRADSWDNPFPREVARWMGKNLPEDANVLSSRLYFSSLYVNTGGRFEVRQVPTVRVDVAGTSSQLISSRSNLFRWGDDDLRASSPDDDWLYLKRYPGKGYWIGLSQQELLAYIDAHHINYVILTGDDGAFSSLSHAAYFSAHPAFELVQHTAVTPADQLFVFSVDRTKLAPIPFSTAIGPASLRALERESGMTPQQLAQALGTPLRRTDFDVGLSQRETDAAVAGVDLASDQDPQQLGRR